MEQISTMDKGGFTIVPLPYLGDVLSGPLSEANPLFSDDYNVTSNHPAFSWQGTGKGAFDNLWPALVQCFTIIVFGYIAGRFNLLNHTQAQGLGSYLSKFALPALLFRSLAVIQFTKVNWWFLLSILVAKLLVFITVAVLTLAIVRPLNLGTVGIYGIFATQSNDIALGYPIISALYASIAHSMEVNYLYLIQPISLIILNPLGFIFLEVHKWRCLPRNQRSSRLGAIVNVVRGIVTNPIVFMSALGIVANFALGRHLPRAFDKILKTLGDSFGGVALFFLGHSMVGRFSALRGATMLTVLLLIAAKMLLMPFLTREIAEVILNRCSPRADVVELSSFAFFYGTLPTAPVVFLFSNQYHVAQTVISTAVVLSTFLALPFMFISAEMLMITGAKEMDYARLLNNTTFDVGWVTVFSCIWVLAVFIIGRRARSIPHQFTMCLAACQLLCVSTLMALVRVPSTPHYPVHWLRLTLFSLHMIGALGCHSWVTAIATSVSVTRIWSLCLVIKYRLLYYIAGFGCPIFTVGVILMTRSLNSTSDGDQYILPYGNVQVIITIVYICLNLVMSIGALVCQHRHDKSYLGTGGRSRTTSENEGSLTNASSLPVQTQARFQDAWTNPPNSLPGNSFTSYTIGSLERSGDPSRGRRRGRVHFRKRPCAECHQNCGPRPAGSSAVEDIENLCTHNDDGAVERSISTQGVTTETRGNDAMGTANEQTPLLRSNELTSYTSIGLLSDQSVGHIDEDMCNIMRYQCDRQTCAVELTAYMERRFYGLDDEERSVVASRDEHQVLRHVILVILMLLVQLAVLFLSLWRVLRDQTTGLYIELEFFNVVLISGQGLFLLGLFGFESQLTLYPLFRKMREKLKRGDVILPEHSDLEEDDVTICDIFVTHHKAQCQQDILDCYWYRLRRYRCVFKGNDLIDWLLEYGLCHDRSTAIEYGSTLLKGRIIEHVQKQHYFYDLPYLYRFVGDSEDSN